MLPTCGAKGNFCIMKSNPIAIRNMQGGAKCLREANLYAEKEKLIPLPGWL